MQKSLLIFKAKPHLFSIVIIDSCVTLIKTQFGARSEGNYFKPKPDVAIANSHADRFPTPKEISIAPLANTGGRIKKGRNILTRAQAPRFHSKKTPRSRATTLPEEKKLEKPCLDPACFSPPLSLLRIPDAPACSRQQPGEKYI